MSVDSRVVMEAAINEVTGRPWPTSLPDIPFFLKLVLEGDHGERLPPTEDAQMSEEYDALYAVLDALKTGSDEQLNEWGEAYLEGWGQS